MFAPAVIFAAFLGITGMDSVFLGKTFLLIADVTGGLERNPEMGPDARILPSAVLGGWEAVPPEPTFPPAGRPPGAGHHRPRPGRAENAAAERELPCRLGRLLKTRKSAPA
jgi:hypothetical protein